MTLSRRNLACFLVLSLLVFSSCRDVKDIQITGVDSFEMKGMENNKLNFSANIGVYNPASISFRISEINLKTSVDGSYIGTLTSDKIVKIPARSDSTYHMYFSLELANLLAGSSILYKATRKKQVTIEMQGYVKARSWFAPRKVDVHETRFIDVPSFSR